MSNGKKLRILLVDDDKIVRKLIANMLIALGYDVVTAQDGREALKIFTTADGFHMILTDINMPDIDGWQLSQRLREIKHGIPIIAITGENPDSILPRLARSSIHSALFKPFKINILKEAIENSLRP